MVLQLETHTFRRTSPLSRHIIRSPDVCPLLPQFAEIHVDENLLLGEDCFEKGSQFVPERWTIKPEMVRYPAAHIPFSIGKSS